VAEIGDVTRFRSAGQLASWAVPAATALPAHPHEVLPYAREHGVTEQQITTMLTANLRRFFEKIA
jgi:predicted metal-dependent phosphotriesterase family hydrolase